MHPVRNSFFIKIATTFKCIDFQKESIWEGLRKNPGSSLGGTEKKVHPLRCTIDECR